MEDQELDNVTEVTDDIESDGVETDEVVETEEIAEEEQEDAQVEFTDTKEDIQEVKTFTQEEVDDLITKRLAREQRKYENTYKPLLNTLKAGGFETDNPLEITQKLRDTYKEQGIELPDYNNTLTEREQKALAKADAEEVIELGEGAMRETFTELYQKPNRTAREEQLMYLIGKENSMRMAKRDLLELGADPDKVMNDKAFKEFASKMASNVPVKEIYQTYQKLHGITQVSPPSAGSVKSNTVTDTKINYNNMSKKDFDKELEKALNGE